MLHGHSIRIYFQFFTLCLVFCGCANWKARVNEDYYAGRVEHKDKSYYADLAEACDFFLKEKELDSEAFYIVDATNLMTSHLPPIINALEPNRIIYTTEGVSVELGKDCSVNWDRDKTRPHLWIMTMNVRGKKKILYEEPSTKYCLAVFGLYDGAGNFIPTNRIPYRVGVQYGWKLSIYSRENQVRIKCIFELPGRGVWSASPTVPEGVTLISNEISPGADKSTREYDLKIRKGGPTTTLINAYGVAIGDPTGTYKISLFLDGQPVKVFSFQVVDQ